MAFFACKEKNDKSHKSASPTQWTPHTGQIQILNGCGLTGVAEDMRSFLSKHGFDIVEFGNAPHWSYPRTLVLARTTNTRVAQDLGKILGTDQVMTLLDSTQMVEATIIIGKDFYQLMEENEQINQ